MKSDFNTEYNQIVKKIKTFEKIIHISIRFCFSGLRNSLISFQMLNCKALSSELSVPTPVSDLLTLQHCRKSILVSESSVGSEGSKVSQVEVSEVPI